jgi:SAM-dependent methyltransferase
VKGVTSRSLVHRQPSGGVIGGRLGYHLIRLLGGSPPRRDPCSGQAYRHVSKLEKLLGPRIWDELKDKVVLDFGCGTGDQAIEIAQHGARRVVGIDTWAERIEEATRKARQAGVGDRCEFRTDPGELVDAVISLDAFEHFADPAGVLDIMGRLARPGGHIYIAFGPWYHPYGGHLFSIFPWAHIIFSENAFMRGWSEFKTDGATRFCEVDGGLNGMTIDRFRRIVRESGHAVEELTLVPIRRTAPFHNRLTQEFLTALVRCRLRVTERS